MNIQCVILFALSFLSIGLAQSDNNNLVCYDCDPDNHPELCGQPTGTSVDQSTCNKELLDRSENSTLICVSAYYTFTGDRVNATGIRRGCRSQDPSVVNYCELLKEEVTAQNIVLTSCVVCNTSRCNNVSFKANGEPNGSPLVQMASTVFCISLLFVLFF